MPRTCALASFLWILAACATPEEEMSPAEWIEANSTVLEQLRSYDELERRQGVSRIKRLGKEQGAGLTYYILSDPKLEDYRLEVILARLLADWRDARAIPFLLRSLQVPDDGAVRIASEGLIVFGEDRHVLDGLSEMLGSATPRDREVAANIFARIGTQGAVETLAARLKSEEDPEVRAQIIIGVIQTRHPRRKEYLVEALTDADEAIREVAWSALRKYPELPKVDYDPRGTAVDRARAVAALRVWLGRPALEGGAPGVKAPGT